MDYQVHNIVVQEAYAFLIRNLQSSCVGGHVSVIFLFDMIYYKIIWVYICEYISMSLQPH